jgi:hypothetical protein
MRFYGAAEAPMTLLCRIMKIGCLKAYSKRSELSEIISSCCPFNSCVVCRHIEQKWTELLRELEERLDQEKETGQKEVHT